MMAPALCLFLLGFVTLMLEIFLTRIFSAVFWYHYTYFVISLALFGLSLAGIAVYVKPGRYPKSRLYEDLTLSAFRAAAFIGLALVVFCHFPFLPGFSASGFVVLVAVSTILSLPFYFLGLSMVLILHHESQNISRLYFANLLGSGVGCLLAISVMDRIGVPNGILLLILLCGGVALLASGAGENISDAREARRCFLRYFFGVTAAVAAIWAATFVSGDVLVRGARALFERGPYGGASFGAGGFDFYLNFITGWIETILIQVRTVGFALIFFLALLVVAVAIADRSPVSSSRLMRSKYGLTAVLILGVSCVVWVGNMKLNILDVRFHKGRAFIYLLSSQWTSLGRTMVHPGNTDKQGKDKPIVAWGLSPAYRGAIPDQLGVNIDGHIGTAATRFDGDSAKVEFVKYDIASLAHYLKENPRVLIIGTGGGKDILSALVFESEEIDAVEINPAVVRAVDETFGDFSGKIYSRPPVRTFVGEGRSFVENASRRYDILQLPMTDSFNATASGAFALSENYLYTREAFRAYLDHLTEDGIFTLTRWMFDPPRQTLRVVSTLRSVMDEMHLTEPGRHVIVAQSKGISTILFKRSVFREDEIKKITSISERMEFDLIYAPDRDTGDNMFTRILTDVRPEDSIRRYRFDVTPSTDDRPFFFQMAKVTNLAEALRVRDFFGMNFQAPLILFVTLMIALALCALFIVVPLARTRRETGHGALSALIYFCCLGLGFMLVEISFVHRFTLFLGHPSYSLMITLFIFLSFSGIGSFITHRFSKERLGFCLRIIIPSVVALTLAMTAVMPVAFRMFLHYPLAYKVMISSLLIIPVATLMGMPFPCAVRIIRERRGDLIPWAWGMNGAFSVLGAVVTLLIAVFFGFTFALYTAAAVYLTALLFIPSRTER